MQLVAHVALQVTQRMSRVFCGGADVRGEIRDASRMVPNGFEQLWTVFNIGELGKNIRQPRLRIA